MKNAKILSILLAQVMFLAVAAYGQGGQGGQARGQDGQALAEIRKEFKALALTDAEIGSLEKAIAKDEIEVDKAQAELKVLQAKLERLMLEKTPPMDEIKALLKESLDWEYRIRLIRLERNIAVRSLLGQERWASLYRVSKAWALVKRSGKNPENLEPRVIKLLEALL